MDGSVLQSNHVQGGGNGAVADFVIGLLADTYALMFKTQIVHWNVKGPLFKSVHDMTEEQYTDLFAAVDELAERVRALGVQTPRSFSDLLSYAQITEESVSDGAEAMVLGLAKDNTTLAQRFKELAEIASENEDVATEDLANARIALHQKTVWMLNALIDG